MFESGLVVGLGLLATLSKMNWTWKLRVLSSPLLMDAIVFVMLIVIHWGTFSGVMVATIGAFMVSVILAVGRWFFGHNENGVYVPGRFDMSHKLGKV